MTASLAVQRVQGLAVLAGAAVMVSLLAWSALAPIIERRQLIADAVDRIETFKLSLRSVEVKNIDTSMVVSAGETVEARSLAVQRMLVDDTTAAGLQMRQLSTVTPREIKPGLVQLSFEVDAAGDLGHVTAFLKLLSDRRPALFIDKLAVKSGVGGRPDLNLSIQMTVSAYVLAQGTKQ